MLIYTGTSRGSISIADMQMRTTTNDRDDTLDRSQSPKAIDKRLSIETAAMNKHCRPDADRWREQATDCSKDAHNGEEEYSN